MSTQKSISRVYSILFILVFMLTLTFSALDVTPAHAAEIRYTKPGGIGNCSDWTNACTLQTALTSALSGDEIRVRAGTYTPGAARTDTFQLKDGVALYGGFAGTETTRTQRNPAANLTTLSGDIGTAGDNSDNSFHVVTGATGATLDGFTITAGNNANVTTYPNYVGGGMYNGYSSPTLTNVTFSGNSAKYGGGMYNGYGSPALINVTFRGNSATYYGGGMYNGYSSPALINVTFSGNSATNHGGGMYNEGNSMPTLTNVTFSGNSAQRGGGMYNDSGSSPQIRNTIFWGNTAGTGAQIYNYDATSTPNVSDSVVQGGCPAGSTCTTPPITADPLLGTLGNYGGFTQTIPLLAGSSAIDTGNDATCAGTDQRGIARPQGAHCDIGAFELVDTTSMLTIFLPLILR